MGGHGDCVEYIVKNSVIVYGLLTIIIKAVKFLNKEEEKEHEKLYWNYWCSRKRGIGF